MDFGNKFGSKKLIKSQFEYHLDRILTGGRSNRISLDGVDLTIHLLAPSLYFAFSRELLNLNFLMTV